MTTEESPSGGADDADERPQGLPSHRLPGQMMAEQFAAMFSESGPTSILDRATDSQIDMMLEQANQAAVREDAYKNRVLTVIAVVSIACLLFLLGLCFIFLKFNAKDSLEQITALIVGLLGGGGIGGGIGFTAGRTSPRSSD